MFPHEVTQWLVLPSITGQQSPFESSARIVCALRPLPSKTRDGVRKTDYAALAETIRSEYLNPGAGCAKVDESEAFKRGAQFAAKRIATAFANRASVKRADFLRACGIDPG